MNDNSIGLAADYLLITLTRLLACRNIADGFMRAKTRSQHAN